MKLLNQQEMTMTKEDRDNRADQMNPNNDAYWQSRGFDEHPDQDASKQTSESKSESNTNQN